MKLAAVLCVVAAIGMQVVRDRFYPRQPQVTEALMYVRSPVLMKRLTLGFDAVAADVYWIRAIQHYGRQRLSAADRQRDYSLLHPLLDITTSLDPYFSIAYRFGAIFLSERYPGGPGRPDLAVALLRKGIAAQPGKWEYYHDIGFVYYWTLGDPVAAADWFRRAAEQPGAPGWLTPVAAAMLTQGQDRASARYLWQQLSHAEEEWMRGRAELALAQLDALDQIDQLHAIVSTVHTSAGEAYSWPLIIRAGRLREAPLDPAGTPYVIDPRTGEVSVSERSPLHPMPRTVPQR